MQILLVKYIVADENNFGHCKHIKLLHLLQELQISIVFQIV